MTIVQHETQQPKHRPSGFSSEEIHEEFVAATGIVAEPDSSSLDPTSLEVKRRIATHWDGRHRLGTPPDADDVVEH